MTTEPDPAALQSLAWRQSIKSISTQFIDDLVALCQAKVLDNSRAIHELLEAIGIMSQIDPDGPHLKLFDREMQRIVPKIGWLEYFCQIVLGNESEYGLFTYMIGTNKDDLDLLGQIILAILQGDLAAVQAKGARLDVSSYCPLWDPVSQIMLKACIRAEKFDPSILDHLVTWLDLNSKCGMFENEFAYSIRKANVAITSVLVAKCIPFASSIWDKKLRKKVFADAWNALISPEEPSDEHHQIISSLLLLFPEKEDPYDQRLTEWLWEFIQGKLSEPDARNPLICVIRSGWITKDRRSCVFAHRWEIRDGASLLAMMEQFEQTPSRVMRWYDSYDQLLARREQHPEQDPLPPKENLDVEWISSLLSSKSARSAQE